MKIVYVSNGPIPSRAAYSIQIMKMCQTFQEMGNDIKLFAPRIDGRSDKGFDYKRHYGANIVFNIRHIRTSHFCHRHDYSLMSAVYAKTARSDLVYSRNLGAAAWSSMLGLSTIYEAHDLPISKAKKIYFEILMKCQTLKRVVVISEALRNLFLEMYGCKLNENMMLVAHDGVDMERFRNFPQPTEAKQKIDLDMEKPVVGYVGHLYKGRGIKLIISLAQLLPEIEFLVVGGEDRTVAEYVDRVAIQGLENIRFVGFIDNSELPLYLAACDILLMPYQRKVAVSGWTDTSKWMSPIKMFEYMATGRLIISSDFPVLREILSDRNSILCQPADVNSWRRAIKAALDDCLLGKTLGDQARKDVEKYTWRRRVKRVINGLESD